MANLIQLVSSRKAFIASVYSTLIVQLLVTFMVVYSLRNHPALSQATNRSSWVYLLATMGLIVVLTVVPMPTWMRLVVFTVFSLVSGALLHNASVKVSREVVNAALTGAIAIFVAMSVAALTLASFGVDLSFMGVYLGAALLGLLVASIVVMFMAKESGKAKKVLTVIGLTLFSVYVAYDTNIMVQPGYNAHFIDAAIGFYLDFINLFTNSLVLGSE